MDLRYQEWEVEFFLLLISHIKNYYPSLNGTAPSTSKFKKMKF